MPEIAESRTFAEAAKPAEGPGRLRVALLTPGWGSSGYYSTDVCEAAGTDRVFTAGTHMYINHPTPTENYERPVRDLTQLAAVLAEDATWNAATSQLEADVITFSNWRAPLAEMAEHIGVSIRAAADVEENGSAEGRDGRIITQITEALSVDFVTKAGRGGKVLEVVEDAFSAGRVAAQHTAEEASSHDVQSALYTLVREAHRSGYAWMRDYDLSTKTVYFEMSVDEKTRTYAQSFTLEGDIPTELTGEATQVRVSTTYVPVAAPSGQSTTTEASQEDTMPQIEEARLRVLEAAEAELATVKTERDKATAAAEEATRALARVQHLDAARTIVESVFDAADITGAKATKSLVAKSFTLKEDGSLDEDALKKVATEAAAELAESRGQGKVRGLGDTPGDKDADISEDDFDAELAKISGRATVKGA